MTPWLGVMLEVQMLWVLILFKNCEVKGIKRIVQVEGIETTKGFIKSKKIGVVAAGHSSVIANMAGIRLPLESKPLQALVSEPVKPIIDTVVMSNAVHAYVSQSDKGELVIGAGTDSYVSYTQKGSHNIVEETLRAILELYPIFSRMKMLRQWGGIVDICLMQVQSLVKLKLRVYILIADGVPEDLKQHQAQAIYLLIQLRMMNHIN